MPTYGQVPCAMARLPTRRSKRQTGRNGRRRTRDGGLAAVLEGRRTIVPKVERDVAKTVAGPNGSGVTAYLECAKLV